MKNAIKQFNICRIVAGFLLGCLLYFGMTSSVFAAESGTCGADLTWELEGGLLTITGSGDMTDYTDSSLAPWYERAKEIKAVSLPSGLTSIGDFAFYDCSNLTSISISAGVADIGQYAFAQCTGLLQIDFGTGVQAIGEGAFQCCETLTAVYFPASLTVIGEKAFYRCYGLREITIPTTVTNMGSSTFTYCTGLVRATVNADLSQLPGWTFYGCTSLVDVSLAAGMTEVGDYAFESCNSLDGIYTQSGSPDAVYDIEKSLEKGEGTLSEGLVSIYDMPESSVVTADDGKVLTQTKVVQSEDAVVSVKNIINYSEGLDTTDIEISAMVEGSDGWIKVAEEVNDVIDSGRIDSTTIEITMINSIVESKDLAMFAGKPMVLELIMNNGVIWKINMSEMSEDSFSGTYDFAVELSEVEASKTKIKSEDVYRVKFAGGIDFNVTVGIKEWETYDLATLYQMRLGKFESIDTIIVDHYDWAWFTLANIDAGVSYYIGMNVEGMTIEQAVIPDTMYEQYDLDTENEEATLMDKDGVKYRITGYSSKWGISGKRFMTYVFVAMAATVLIVAVVMISLNIIKRSKERYADLAMSDEEKAATMDEEALRMEIMRELLGKSKKE